MSRKSILSKNVSSSSSSDVIRSVSCPAASECSKLIEIPADELSRRFTLKQVEVTSFWVSSLRTSLLQLIQSVIELFDLLNKFKDLNR